MISFHFEVDTIMVVIGMNVILTGLHFGLFKLYQSKKWKWSDNALKGVDFLLTALSIVSANLRHPPDKSEVEK